MEKYPALSLLSLGLANAVTSSFYFSKYLSEKDIHGRDILKGASAYIREYKEDNPQEVFNYVKKSIEITSKLNDYKIEEISDLEKEVISASEEIGSTKSKTLYEPVLQGIDNKIEVILNIKEKNLGSLIAGTLSGIASFCFLLATYISLSGKKPIQR